MKDPITDKKFNTRWVKIINPIGFLCLSSLQRHEATRHKIKRKEKAKMSIATKKKKKEDVSGKMNLFPSPGNPQKDYVDENTNSMFDENEILQDEENGQYDFRKTIVEKDEKKIKTRGEKKKTSSFQICKNNLEKEI